VPSSRAPFYSSGSPFYSSGFKFIEDRPRGEISALATIVVLSTDNHNLSLKLQVTGKVYPYRTRYERYERYERYDVMTLRRYYVTTDRVW
jgi:hypothetical protein